MRIERIHPDKVTISYRDMEFDINFEEGEK